MQVTQIIWSIISCNIRLKRLKNVILAALRRSKHYKFTPLLPPATRPTTNQEIDLLD
jgi:hypothetical protein